jgi:hypothetical protein
MGQKAVHRKMSPTNQNWSQLVEHIKMKSHFSNSHVTMNICIYDIQISKQICVAVTLQICIWYASGSDQGRINFNRDIYGRFSVSQDKCRDPAFK